MFITVLILATLAYSNSEYIPPGPAYNCPKGTDAGLLYPCVCENGTDAGLYIRCVVIYFQPHCYLTLQECGRVWHTHPVTLVCVFYLFIQTFCCFE